MLSSLPLEFIYFMQKRFKVQLNKPNYKKAGFDI